MSDDTPKTKVYYNSACPVCRSGIESQQGKMSSCEIEWIDVHANPEAVKEVGAELEQVRERLYVQDAQGRIHVGADAFSKLWRDTPQQRWIGRLLALPVIRQLTQWTYNAFARCLYRWNRKKGHW